MRSVLGGSCGGLWSLVGLLLVGCGGEVDQVGRGSRDGGSAGRGGNEAGATFQPSQAGTAGATSGGSGSGGETTPTHTGGSGGSIAAGGGRGGSGGRPTGGQGGGIDETGGAGAGRTGGTGPNGGRGGSGAVAAGGSSGGARCQEPLEIPGTKAVYDLASAEAATASTLDFFDYPWPALARKTAALSGFPNPPAASGCASEVSDPALATLVDAMDPVDYRAYLSELGTNFLSLGPNAASIYIRFDGALSVADLPTPHDSLDARASRVVLVNLDAARPARGRLVPILTRVFESSRYLKPHTLSILPHPGFPLEPRAMYAAVVRRDLGDGSGRALGSPQQLESLKQKRGCATDTSYVSAFDLLDAELGIGREQIAAMTVFQAGSPTEELGSVLEQIDAIDSPASLAAPQVTAAVANQLGYYDVYGTFNTLIYQYGEPPYLPELLTGNEPVTFEPQSEDGRLLVAAPPATSGGNDTTRPRTERIDYRLSLPFSLVDTGELSGVPVVVFGAGTGGGPDSPFALGIAERLSGLGLAVLSTTPVMHGARAHSENIDPTLLTLLDVFQPGVGAQSLIDTVESGELFGNPLNLQAAKGNSLQAAVDYAWQARWLGEVTLQANFDGVERTVRFDPQRVYFFGHSQGAGTGPLLASSRSLGALMLSAPGGHLPTNLLGKTEPSDTLSISSMLDYLVCDDPSEPLDVHHPVLNLLLYWFEQADAQNYAPLLIREAPFGGKHVFVTAGINDHYVASGSHDAVTTAARLNQLSPGLASVAGQDLLAVIDPNWGFGKVFSSLTANGRSPDGSGYTAAFRQYSGGSACGDDHFLYTCDAETIDDWQEFFAGLVPGKAPTVTGE
ncbi:MAG: hypothetical protein JW940_20815 [Polyangiaceae bacterium]|nr:hypothetical protein [Polyangiaceae bacterium]